MAEPKTKPTAVDVTAFLEAVPDARRRAEGLELRALMERVTGAPAAMWGPTMVGFGTTQYTVTTGTHDTFIVGFSPRKAALTIYGVSDSDGLDALGPHTLGKGCLYVKRLDAVDVGVLEQLVRRAWGRVG